ncbi:Acetylcholinesterase-1 [Halotydeus destructor]|nr:Acetylcholinesterase-1 [Halotydeus destructor]
MAAIFLLAVFLLPICSCLNSVDVETKYGVVRGQRLVVKGQKVHQFISVPYARPPVGQLRFAKPLEPLPWSPRIRDATKSNITYCPENHDETKKIGENCLYLNIWTPGRPAGSPLLPVYLYLYGGNYDFFGIDFETFNASYAVRNDVIMVLPTFRGNVFGYFNGNRTDAPGNLGLWDQAMAIKWTYENIEPFGGDPDRITVAGASSGAAAAFVLAVSPVTRPYISKTMLLSASVPGYKPNFTIGHSKDLATLLGCNTTTDYVKCLRRVSVAKLLTAKSQLENQAFSPNTGDEIFPISVLLATRQGRYNKSAPLFFGGSLTEFTSPMPTHCPEIVDYTASSNYSVTRAMVKQCFEAKLAPSIADKAADYYLKDVNESDSHALQVAAAKGYGDYIFSCPTYFSALAVSEKVDSGHVFSYYLTYGPEIRIDSCATYDWPRPCHGDELSAMFGEAFTMPQNSNDSDRTYTDQMIGLWTSFTKTGRPPVMGGYRWPAYQDRPVAPITPVNLGSQSRPVWPSYLEVNPLKTPQPAPVYKPYRDCDTFWSKHMDLFIDPPAVTD